MAVIARHPLVELLRPLNRAGETASRAGALERLSRAALLSGVGAASDHQGGSPALVAGRLVTRVRLAAAVSRAAPPSLRTPRLELRPIDEPDRTEFLRVLSASAAHLSRFCPIDKRGDAELSPDEAFSRQLELARAGDRTGHAWRRVAFDRRGRLIGCVNINDIARGLESTGEVVLWLAADATGSGFAREMLSAAMDHAFADLPLGLGLHKLVGLIAEDNLPSRRVAVRCGFEPGIGDEPVELIINGERVTHRPVVAYAPVARSILHADESEKSPGEAREPRRGEGPLVRGLRAVLDLESLATRSRAG